MSGVAAAHRQPHWPRYSGLAYLVVIVYRLLTSWRWAVWLFERDSILVKADPFLKQLCDRQIMVPAMQALPFSARSQQVMESFQNNLEVRLILAEAWPCPRLVAAGRDRTTRMARMNVGHRRQGAPQ